MCQIFHNGINPTNPINPEIKTQNNYGFHLVILQKIDLKIDYIHPQTDSGNSTDADAGTLKQTDHTLQVIIRQNQHFQKINH